MKIKRFLAKDMRAALAQVKETLGDDAVIMSNKKVAGGIEIVAAVDFDDPSPRAMPQLPNTAMLSLGDDKVSLGDDFSRVATPTNQNQAAPDSLQALLERQQGKLAQQKQTEADENELPEWSRALQQHKQAAAEPKLTPVQPARNTVAEPKLNSKVSASEIDAVRQELATMRNLLTHQLSSLMNDQQQRNDPVGAMLKSKLLEADFSLPVATKLAELSQRYQPGELTRVLPQYLANMLDNHGDDIVRQGGIVALVGPTGVGKTTTLAKLAARYAARHGVDKIALVTTDHYRIGAYEQLATYGKIMGCPVKQAHDLNELEQVLYQLRSRQLILIDTAGMGQRDLRLYQQLDNLAADNRIPIRSYLVLSSTSQRRVLEDAISHFQRIPLTGAVLSKLDESISLAGALSVLIDNKLPLNYVTDGQRVPEDMRLADTIELARKALAAMDEQSKSQDTYRSKVAYAFE